ncbi:MAG TPA: DUF4926 domain-containing protein [Bacteroidota bacterium]|nr:DUF4926 domain-containing protein [Bacteroidota bacterium]
MFKELETVVLTKDIPQHGLKEGDIGTIVHLHPKGGYEVEFVTLRGDTVAVVSLAASDIRTIADREIPHARVVA